MISSKKIILNNLEIGYKHKICNNINLSEPSGQVVCLIGKNGTGKSTLLKTMAGVINPISGEFFYNNTGIDKCSIKQKAKIISFVPSKLFYSSNLNVYELIGMGRAPYTNLFNKLNEQDLKKINNAISDFGIEHIKHKPLTDISDGEKQKAMICRAFVQDTDLILLDEPTAFLDYPSKIELLNRLKSLSEINKKTIIFSSHDLELSLKISDSTWIFLDKDLKSYSVNKLKETDVLSKHFDYNP